MKIPLVLYSTLGCHLCELAKELVFPLLEGTPFVFEEVDIADDEALMERYGVTIPVLASKQSLEELNWPFSSEEVSAYLTRLQATN